MRIIISLILSLMLIVTFSGCKEKTQIEKAQEKIVSIGEQFLDYELTIDEAREKLDSIVIPEIDGNGDLFLKTDKNALSYLILKTKTNSSSFDEIREQIDNIKNSNYEN